MTTIYTYLAFKFFGRGTFLSCISVLPTKTKFSLVITDTNKYSYDKSQVTSNYNTWLQGIKHQD